MTAARLKRLFSDLRAGLLPLLERIVAADATLAPRPMGGGIRTLLRKRSYAGNWRL